MVITLDKRKKPLGFCSEKRARKLIENGRACVYRYYPFAIIIKDADVNTIKPKDVYRIKIDPGSKYTGIAIVKEQTNEVMLYMQIEHRAQLIVDNLQSRKGNRNNRRQRETRYRPCKWINRKLKKDSKYSATAPRPKGWLPPSVKSIGDNILSWVDRLYKLITIRECSFEAVRFDTQLMDNPNIEGVEYQQGTLFGYEAKEFLMDKFGHTCQYCGGKAGDSILEWEHIIPKSRGGSDSMKNATLACHTCNQDKSDMFLEEWLAIESRENTKLAEARVKGIQNVMDGGTPKMSNRYCAWVSSCRRYVETGLFARFGNVECSSGSRTKFNRTQLGLPKDHHYDALCIGNIPENGFENRTNGYCLYVKAMGRGTRFRGQANKCGVITTKYLDRAKRRFDFYKGKYDPTKRKPKALDKRKPGFQNGDIVFADIPNGKFAGRHVGRLMTRASGNFDIRTTTGELIGASHKYCKIRQRECGYQFACRKN